jgi:hypothetical protein
MLCRHKQNENLKFATSLGRTLYGTGPSEWKHHLPELKQDVPVCLIY